MASNADQATENTFLSRKRAARDGSHVDNSIPRYDKESISTRCTGGRPTILDLSNEVILCIFSHLQAIRLAQPQSQVFRNRKKEIARQWENYFRRTALYALSLTSRRMNALAVPILYGSFTGSTTIYGSAPLWSLWNTLMQKPELRHHIRYIENLLIDCVGNELRRDLTVLGTDEMVRYYFRKLAETISMCPNIQQLSVISVELGEVSLWMHLLPDSMQLRLGGEIDRGPIAGHGLLKLEIFAFQANAQTSYGRLVYPSLYDIFSSLVHCPSLMVLHASGLVEGGTEDTRSIGIFKKLQRLELTECMLSISSFERTILCCKGLRHLVCHWSYLSWDPQTETVEWFSDLIKMEGTLESLWLLVETLDISSPSVPMRSFSSLSRMRCLKELKLCDLFFPNRQSGDPLAERTPSIASQLPPSLEHLTVSYAMRRLEEWDFNEDLWHPLRQLVKDCPFHLPHLRSVVCHISDTIDFWEARELVELYEELGIWLSFTNQLDIHTRLGDSMM